MESSQLMVLLDMKSAVELAVIKGSLVGRAMATLEME